ncbi:MAG: hypothetical protein M3Q07_00525 [Pseudobdellovibrionaceae bacterium]|nr:hypothetical protein [Pseudobdellovibrionaceae bacterium]
MQTLSMYLSILSLSMSVGACFKMPIQSKGSVSVLDGSARPLEATQVSDVKSMATIDPAAKTAQRIAAPTSGDLSGSSVTFPPGALGISTDMIIEKASDFSQTTLFQELDLDQDVNVTSVGSGLIIRPTESASLTMPMVINMPIPLGASLQLQSTQNLTVFYKQFVGDSLISGVIPGQNITVNADGTCSFEGYFGVYWVALVSVPIVTAKTVKTEEPIINAQDGVERSLNLAYAGTSSDFPLMTAAVSDVCAGQRFYDANGDLLEGSDILPGINSRASCS